MKWLGALAAVILIAVVLVDAFEAVALPRRVRHSYRLAPMFYRSAWVLWRALGGLLFKGSWRHGFLSVFGPLSLFGLLIMWATGLITGFALLHWSFDTALSVPGDVGHAFGTYFYFSGTTFFTLGYGDVVPMRGWGRALSVAESGLGFGFLAIVISYVPVLYQKFSERELTISLLDARAGSPPSAGEFLQRVAHAPDASAMGPILVEWERWSAQLLEGHLSFPVVSYYRSQHDNQSWVSALAVILDTSAFLIAIQDKMHACQARNTFAIARHAAVDLGLVFQLPTLEPRDDRLSASSFARLTESLRHSPWAAHDSPEVESALKQLRQLYEPFVNTLADYFEIALSPFVRETNTADNWQTSPWMPRAPAINQLGEPVTDLDDSHPSDDEVRSKH
jgi:hypothetical protein